MALYKRTNGLIVTVNDTPGSFEYAESLGWVKQEEQASTTKTATKRKRRTKKEMAEDQ